MLILRNASPQFDVVEGIPLAIPGRRDRCWVTSLTTLAGPVAREEIRRELKGIKALSACALSAVAEAVLRLSNADKVVFPAHLLLTTSLYGHGEAERVHASAGAVAAVHPDRAVVVRSLNRRDHAGLLGNGATLWPVRVVWIIDDSARDWRPRRDVRRDLQALETCGLERGHYAGRVPAARIDRVLALYRRLYIGRYSRHNPDYTTDYIAARLASGDLELLTLEDKGRIVAFCAIHVRGDMLSIPLVGYELEVEGLYRLIMTLPGLVAEARGLRRNLSAGASRFKRHRGAKPHVEYLMILDDHLPFWRRWPYRVIAVLLQALESQLIKAATP